MIFNEIYSAYYNAVAKIIDAILKTDPKEKDLQRIVVENAFSESVLTILPSIKEEKWQIIKRDLSTPIKNSPTQPLTTLEKRWLRSISEDARVKLFDISAKGLEDVDPLFTSDDYYVYDKCADGDPYEDENYIKCFKTVLRAIKEKLPLNVEVQNKSGREIFVRCRPTRLEYSEKDDKFRVFVSGCRYASVINIARIKDCSIYRGEHVIKDTPREKEESSVLIEISDERMTLGELAGDKRALEELVEHNAYRLGLGASHSVAVPLFMLNNLYSTPASSSVFCRRCLLQSVINIWPNISPPTTLKSCATRRISSLSNRSSRRSIGRSSAWRERSVYSASLSATRNDFC